MRQTLDILVTKGGLAYQFFVDALALTANEPIVRIVEPEYLASERYGQLRLREEALAANVRAHQLAHQMALHAAAAAPPLNSVLQREIEQLSYADIAAALQIQEGTVKSRIARARAALLDRYAAATGERNDG